MAELNERGHEILDSTPTAMPVGFKKPESLQAQIQRLVRNELSARAANNGMESFEEADDFDVGDDDGDFHSKHELDDEQERFPTPRAARAEVERIERRIAKRRNKWRSDEESSSGNKPTASPGKDPSEPEKQSTKADGFGSAKP